MFGWFRGSLRLIENQYDFLARRFDALEDRFDNTGDDRKEWLAIVREIRATHREQLHAMQGRIDALEKHVHNQYGWTSAIALKHDLDAPPPPPGNDAELSEEEIEQRTRYVNRILENPVASVPLNVDDMLDMPEFYEPVERDLSEEERPKDAPADSA